MNTAPSSSRSLSIEAPAEFIELLGQLNVAGLKSGIPVPSSSPVDLLDAPMNKKKAASALQILTLLLSTSTAAVKLADEVEKFVKDNPGIVITIRDAASGSLLGKFDEASPRPSIDDHLKP